MALVVTVAAAPRPEATIKHMAQVDREVDGGRTTQAIWYVMDAEEAFERKSQLSGVSSLFFIMYAR